MESTRVLGPPMYSKSPQSCKTLCTVWTQVLCHTRNHSRLRPMAIDSNIHPGDAVHISIVSIIVARSDEFSRPIGVLTLTAAGVRLLKV
ncbi:hypothetical protein JTE90_015729 [Oedothorax gibbosus]|uniref:Uncharacterized protein n=1 Tax=Oedothorax gibbosus TaxID=931172 RepID=A0AAV6TZY4_9ARAC|nr:hypothetical protein JTE90_015729 [Oedothorax gibbosus]